MHGTSAFGLKCETVTEGKGDFTNCIAGSFERRSGRSLRLLTPRYRLQTGLASMTY
jgi:hypothetical protein